LIHLFTDFGWAGPYVGEMKAVLARSLPGVSLIDLMHDAPAFNSRASAYLLAALGQRFTNGDICLAVVDPGVGDAHRRAIVLDTDGICYVGPDNGLFAVLARRAAVCHCQEILWRPADCSDSFHGRDVFAPVAARLYQGMSVETRSVSPDSLVGMDFPAQLAEVIYIDHYGNAVTGLNAGHYPPGAILTVAGQQLVQARTFSSVAAGEAFWYANSMGLVEIAANQVNVAALLGLSIGSAVAMHG
jgi:S-adenosylmethionine hydrolase